MIKLKSTVDYRVETEADAVNSIEAAHRGADDGGYVVTKATYSLKQKKAKGEVVDQGYLVSITYEYLKFWDEV